MTMIKISLRSLSVTFATLLASAAAVGQPEFEIQDLGNLGFGNTRPFAISETGHVAGDSLDRSLTLQAFRWVDGSITSLKVGAGMSRAFGISPEGVVAGWHENPGSQAILWFPDGAHQFLPIPAGFIGSEAFDATDGGLAVGARIDGVGDRLPSAWVDGDHVELAAQQGTAAGVNEAGTIVGDVLVDGFPAAAVWTDAGPESVTQTILPDLGSNAERANAISETGVIVGSALSAQTSKFHAVTWEDGEITDLGLFQDFFPTNARDVNDEGVVVGDYFIPASDEHRAIMWIDRQPVDLNTTINPELGWTLEFATGITNDGRIVGFGTNANLTTVRGFLLTPAEDCPADVNGDGSLSILDFIAFQELFEAGDTGADCNEDGELNVVDFVCFQGVFAAGCP